MDRERTTIISFVATVPRPPLSNRSATQHRCAAYGQKSKDSSIGPNSADASCGVQRIIFTESVRQLLLGWQGLLLLRPGSRLGIAHMSQNKGTKKGLLFLFFPEKLANQREGTALMSLLK